MELELLNSLIVITEAKAPPVKAPKIAKDVELKTEPTGDEDSDTSFAPEKTTFFFRPKFDVYGNLEQTENQELRRETKRVYSMFGREHERAAVYGITSGSEREFKRISRMLGISTDGEVNLERVKRAGFTLAGRIGAKRLMKRGNYVVSLVGPSDDQTAITFYTSKPAEKVSESKKAVGENVEQVLRALDRECDMLIENRAPQAEATAFKEKIQDTLADDSIDNFAIIGRSNKAMLTKLKTAGYR